MANEVLTRTPTSSGNRKKFTWAGWIKRNDIDASGGNGYQGIFAVGTADGAEDTFMFSADQIRLRCESGSDVTTSQSYRDSGNWMHVMMVVDTTLYDPDHRCIFYVNGVKSDVMTQESDITQNANLRINSVDKHYLGEFPRINNHLDGQIFDVFLVDGQALTPDVFGFYKDGDGYMSSGTTNATDFRPGQWSPRLPKSIKHTINRSGGFGVNGFYLPMNDSSNPGADFHCTPNSVIKLKGEDLPQPRNGAPATSDAFVSQVRKEVGSLGFAGCIKVDNYSGLVVSDHSDLDLGTGDYTIEGFYYIDDSNASSGYHALFDFRGTSGANGTYPAMFRHPNGHIYLYLDSAVRIDNVGIPTNEWIHVALSRSSGTTKLFVDGTERGSFSDTISYLCRELKIGHSATQSNPMRGFISNFRVVKGTAVYTSNFTKPTKPLENITNTIVLLAQSATSATAGVAPATIATYNYSGSHVFATTSEITGSTSLAVAGAATGTGANLVTNGTFDTNTTGWTSEASATLSFDNGRLKVLTTNTSYGSANQTVTGLTVGQRYTFQTNMYYGNDSLVTVLSGAVSVNSGWQSADFLWTYSFTAGSTSLLIDLQMASNSGKYGFWDNIILKAEDLPRDYSADIKGSGSNITVVSQGEAGIAYDIPSNYGSVMDFNTDTERLYYNLDGTGRGTNDFTMECWFYPTRQANTWGIIMQHATNSTWYNGITLNSMHGAARQFAIYHNNGSSSHIILDPHVNYEFNQWYHVCAERHNDVLTLYVNGIAKGFIDVTGNSYSVAGTPASSAQYALSLGAQSDGSYPSDGYITDARVYDGIAKYKGGFDVPKPYTPVGIEAFRTVADTCKNNFATYNPLRKSSNQTLSDGNLTCTQEGSVWGAASSTIGMDESSGKYYVEYRVRDTQYSYIGIANADSLVFDLATVASGYSYMGATANDWGYLSSSGGLRHNTGYSQTGGAVLSAGDILGITFDTSNKEAKWYKNGALQYTQTLTGNYPFFFAGGSYQSSNIVNFGQNPSFSGTTTAGTNADSNGKGLFKYAPPSGFLALCEDNLPTPAIADPGKHFKTVLYTGDLTVGRSITGVGFKPDLIWIKKRNSSSDHRLFDSVRGATNALKSNSTDIEFSNNAVISFDNNGWSASAFNNTGDSYVGWCWKAGGAAVSNTDGTITSQVSANQTAGFSIVSYTGNNTTNSTVGHGLGKTPSVVITKSRSNSQNPAWHTSHVSLAPNYDLALDSDTAAWTPTGNGWHELTSSSVFTLKNGSSNGYNVNRNGDNYIAYCWTEIEGYSKFGSYVGNNSADGPFVYCGFKPAWVMVKRVTTGGSEGWTIFDSSRGPSNPNPKQIYANSSIAEGDASGRYKDFVSNGFKVRGTSGEQNTSGITYIFMAFAESPFQTANAK